MNFKELGLSNAVLEAIKKAGFEKPSEIQEKSIPVILEGLDVIGKSATGSGKTLAFGSPILDKISPGKGIQALILTPTRELAEQNSQALKFFSAGKKISISEVYGGVSIEPQIRKLRNTDIVMGTPGRVLDHLSRKTIDLSNIKFLVLDEADRMVDMGFLKDVEKIIKSCPSHRQTLLFSATISPDIDYIAKKYMKDPHYIYTESYVDPSKLNQVYYEAQSQVKFSLLVHLLKNEKKGLVMVFCNTRRNADLLADNLGRIGIHATAIHGGLTQNRRNTIMEKFHARKVEILICTDVAARGLDIKDVSHVYNYDVPASSDDYIHRIGRTARAGEEGKAITILTHRDFENFRRVLSNHSVKIKELEVPKDLEQVPFHVKSSGSRFDSKKDFGERPRRDFGRSGDHERGSRGSGRFGGSRGSSRSGGYSRNSDRESSGRSDRSGGRRFGSGGSRSSGSSFRSGNSRRYSGGSRGGEGSRGGFRERSFSSGGSRDRRNSRDSNRSGSRDPGRRNDSRGHSRGSGRSDRSSRRRY